MRPTATASNKKKSIYYQVPHLTFSRSSFLIFRPFTFKWNWIPRSSPGGWRVFFPGRSFNCIRMLFFPFIDNSNVELTLFFLFYWQHSSNNGPSPSSSSSSCSPLTAAATYSRRLLGRGSWFGDSVLDDSPRDATASTRGPCKLLRVEQRDFRSLWQVKITSLFLLLSPAILLTSSCEILRGRRYYIAKKKRRIEKRRENGMKFCCRRLMILAQGSGRRE
jgi:CRP-like cAMP-binding protein